MSEGMDLKRYLDIAIRRWWILVIPPILGLAAGLVYFRQAPKWYRVVTTVEVQEQQIPREWMPPTVTTSVQERASRIEATLLSDDSLAEVAREIGLVSPEAGEEERRRVLDELRDSLSVSPDETRRLFTIFVVWPNQEQVAPITRAFSQRFVTEHQALRLYQASKLKDLMEESARKSEQALANARENFARFQRSNYNLLPERQEINLRKIDQYQKEIETLNQDIEMREQSIKDLQFQRGLTDPSLPGQEIPEDPEVSALRDRLFAKQQELGQARANLSEEHPTVRRLQREVEGAESALDERVNEVLRELATVSDGAGDGETLLTPQLATIDQQIQRYEDEIEMKNERKTLLDGEISSLRSFVDTSAEVSIEYQRLSDDLAILNEAHLQTQGELAAAREGEALELSGESEAFRVLNEPRRPRGPFRPDLIQSCLMGAVAGLFLGVGIVALLELFDQSYKSEEQLAADFDLAILATVPNLNMAMAQARRRRSRENSKRTRRKSRGRRSRRER